MNKTNLTDGEVIKRRLQCRFLNLELKDNTCDAVEDISKKDRKRESSEMLASIEKGSNCCAHRTLALHNVTEHDTNICKHGKNCHIDRIASHPKFASTQTPGAEQACSKELLADADLSAKITTSTNPSQLQLPDPPAQNNSQDPRTKYDSQDPPAPNNLQDPPTRQNDLQDPPTHQTDLQDPPTQSKNDHHLFE